MVCSAVTEIRRCSTSYRRAKCTRQARLDLAYISRGTGVLCVESVGGVLLRGVLHATTPGEGPLQSLPLPARSKCVFGVSVKCHVAAMSNPKTQTCRIFSKKYHDFLCLVLLRLIRAV